MGKAAISEDVQTVLTVIESLVDQYPALVHTWRIAASTVYALQLYLAAASHPTPERSSEDDFIPDTKDNIKKLLDGESPSLDWERGFWFNAIIMRVDVLWERLFKLCLPDGVKCSGPSLYFLVEDYRTEKTNISYAESSFGQVRKIVNQIKHEPGGADPQFREQKDLPLKALKDLLKFLEDEEVCNRLESFKERPVLAGRRKRY